MATNVVGVLNELIETSKDGERGFRKAAEDAHETQLRTLFLDTAQDCAEGARELQDVVQRMGGKPETSGTMAGAMHRGWVDMRSAVAGRSDLAILEECEKGEDVAKKRYTEALQADLPADVHGVIERQYQHVLQNHDRIRDVRNQFRAAQR